ncbi:MAG: MFS transporter [Proteobacteria bacterium]|nr:MFS transporter [Pseudomonadota bacterium]
MITHKKLLGALLVATVALMIGGIDIYQQLLPSLVDYFGSTPEFMQFTIVVSPIVSACVGFIWGRCADLYSHKKLMLTAVSLFGIGALFCSYTSSSSFFLMGRIVQAIGGSGLSILTVVLLYDLFEKEKDHARYMALYGAMFPAVFALSPVLGAHISQMFDWQSCFKFVFILSFIFFYLYAKFLPQKDGIKKDLGPKESAFIGIKNILKDKIFIFYVLGHTLPVCISMQFTANSPFIFQECFLYSVVGSSYIQLIPTVLNFIGAFYYRNLLKKKTLEQTIKYGGLSSFTFFLFGIGLILLPWKITPYSLIFTLSIFTFYMSFSISSCYTKAVENRIKDRGIAVATVSTARNLLGGIVVLLSSYFYNETPYPMLTSMLILSGFLSLLLLVIIPKNTPQKS